MKSARNASRSEYRDERGFVLVEMAFAMPVLALIFLSVIDVGLVVREHQILQNAAREGARYLALPQNQISQLNPNASLTDIKNFVIQYAAQEKITVAAGNITGDQTYPIALGGGTSATGSLVTITYTRSFQTIARPFFPAGSLQLTGRSVFRNLY